ncbi:MAG: hypothetical protein DRZ82_07175 [Thermoprotei archaeon]|nr:MAG: hypothetical protein DRZ82_07175 [Thermoprotei archaeon]
MINTSRLTKRLKELKRDRAALTGIETAIILIAFVIVAAAFAFVVLNMGFYTSQRSKTVIQSGLGEASSAIELDGSVVAYGEPGDGNVPSSRQNITGLVIYIKLSSGRYPVELNEGKLVISYANARISFDNLYNSSLVDGSFPVCQVVQVVGDNDTILEEGEKFKIFINLTALENFLSANQGKEITGLNAPPGWKPSDVYLHPHDIFRIEIKPPVGAILTVERIIPPSIDKVMNLD